MFAPILVLALQVSAEQRIEPIVQGGIDAGAFPGAVVVIGTRERVLHAQGFGHFTWQPDSPIPDPDSTLFDLASLTKVTATLPAVMRLVERGRLSLDSAVQYYVPEFVGQGKHRVTVRHLLEHRSGMRAFLPLNTETSSVEEARARVLSEPLRWSPAERVEYSDLNAMLLGWVVESVSEASLAAFAVEAAFAPLGMRSTMFTPPPTERDRMAPVGLWRGHVITGELHDQNAVRLGGVSGHAGLYGTGMDLARYAMMWLGQGRFGEAVVFRTGMIAHFSRRGPGNRALGWEMRDTTQSDNTGSRMSPATFGHTGFTGTSIWIDPERDVFVVLLTNRVFAPRTNRSISVLKRVRGALADAAVDLRYEACGRAPSC